MPALVPVSVIAVLLLAATLIHLDKFDLDSLFGWFWLVVYCSVPVALAVLVRRQLTVPREPGGVGDTPMPAVLRGALALQALVMGANRYRAVGVAVQRGDDLALAPDPAHGARRGRIPDRLRGGRRLRRASTTGSSGSAAPPTPTRPSALLELLAAAIFSEDFDSGESALYVAFAASVLLVGLAGLAVVRRAEGS